MTVQAHVEVELKDGLRISGLSQWVEPEEVEQMADAVRALQSSGKAWSIQLELHHEWIVIPGENVNYVRVVNDTSRTAAREMAGY